MMNKLATTCYRCGAQGATKYKEGLNAWVHHDMRRCVSALRANAKAAEKRVQELEAQLAEMEARADRNQGSADVLDTMEELMFGWEDDD